MLSLGISPPGRESHLRWYGGRRFYSDRRVPFTGWQNRHGVQELVDAGQQVSPVFRLVRHVVKDLVGHESRHGTANFMETRDSTLDKTLNVKRIARRVSVKLI